MRRIIFALILGLITINSKRQTTQYYAKGYLLYNKDTTWCRIWFNPSSPFFKASLNTWQNEKAVEISLVKNDSLSGFGIIDDGNNLHYGRIIFKGKNGKATMYVLKIIAGVVELYEHHYVLVSTVRGTQNTTRKNYFNYYLGRTDTDPVPNPTLLPALKKKYIIPFIEDNKKLCAEMKEKLTPEELLNAVILYNKEWYYATH